MARAARLRTSGRDRWRGLARALVVALAVLVGGTAPARAQPANDTCSTATVIDELPFHESANLTTATPDQFEWSPCTHFNDVWYEFTSAVDQTLRFHPEGTTIAGLQSFRDRCEYGQELGCSALIVDPGEDLLFRACAGTKYVFRLSPLEGYWVLGLATFTADAIPGPPDLDGDGRDDCTEDCPDVANPNDTDDDQDGIEGACDNCPDVANPDQPNRDGDPAGDVCDGCPENGFKTDPGLCGCETLDLDDDGDGLVSCLDNCPFSPNPEQTDSDGDGEGDPCDDCPADPDKTDPGRCGCGVSDADDDGDSVESCHDECPADPDKPRPGLCGCGMPELDPDRDGVPACIDNCADLANADQGDLDSDGLGDRCECANGGCLPGDSEPATDCDAELVPPAGALVQGNTLRCADGAPCDADAASDVCAIELVLCVGNDDPALPQCTPARPRRISFDRSIAASGEDVLLALASLPGARAVDTRTVVVDPAPTGPAGCTTPFRVRVPVGEVGLELQTEGNPGRVDRDRFRLLCEPGDP
jgi:hypothetical protein